MEKIIQYTLIIHFNYIPSKSLKFVEEDKTSFPNSISEQKVKSVNSWDKQLSDLSHLIEQKEKAKKASVTTESNELNQEYSDFPEGTITHLSTNGIKFLLENDKILDKSDPRRELILQIIYLKEFPQRADKNIKMRLHLSDGRTYITAFFVNSPNENSVSLIVFIK